MAMYRLYLTHLTHSRGLSAHAHARYMTRNDHRAASATPARAPERERSAHAASLDRSGTATRGGYRDDLVHAEHGNMPGWAQENPRHFGK